jgi:succinyl-CoA synthetase beta subunit
MKIHEYQAKELLAERGVPVPRGQVLSSATEARGVARDLGGAVVVKAQVLAGGRGKAGGIKLVATPKKAAEATRSILGSRLSTYQSGGEGFEVATVLIEEQVPIARELYLAITTDRATACETIIASAHGGMDIEEIAATDPAAILRETVLPASGLWPFQIRKIAAGLKLEREPAKLLGKLLTQLIACYRELDCDLLEINPLAVTTDGRLVALDAKMNIEDNALYRQPKLREMGGGEAEDANEAEAAKIGVSYIRMDGDIGCVVNGAGLAMTTMDILHLFGGQAANFLDVGGSADADRIAGALRLILTDPEVKVIFINIFGGILRCDIFARGLLEAVKRAEAKVPLVVRLIGTNQEEGKRILDRSGLSFIVNDDLESAAAQAVAIAKGSQS